MSEKKINIRDNIDKSIGDINNIVQAFSKLDEEKKIEFIISGMAIYDNETIGLMIDNTDESTIKSNYQDLISVAILTQGISLVKIIARKDIVLNMANVLKNVLLCNQYDWYIDYIASEKAAYPYSTSTTSKIAADDLKQSVDYLIENTNINRDGMESILDYIFVDMTYKMYQVLTSIGCGFSSEFLTQLASGDSTDLLDDKAFKAIGKNKNKMQIAADILDKYGVKINLENVDINYSLFKDKQCAEYLLQNDVIKKLDAITIIKTIVENLDNDIFYIAVQKGLLDNLTADSIGELSMLAEKKGKQDIVISLLARKGGVNNEELSLDIEESAKDDVDIWDYEIKKNKITLTRYRDHSPFIKIPSIINDLPVSSISDGAINDIIANKDLCVIYLSVKSLMKKVDDILCPFMLISNEPMPPSKDDSPENRPIVYHNKRSGYVDAGLVNGLVWGTKDGQNVSIVKYIGVNSRIDIPSTINDMPVIDIARDAFIDCITLDEVHLPEMNKLNAFSAFPKLSLHIYAPNKIAIDKKVPDIERIGNITIHMPFNAKDIKARNEAIQYIFNDTEYSDYDNELVLSKDETNRRHYANNLVKKIVVEEGVTAIEELEFAGFSALEALVLPSSLRIIGDGAFRGCKKLSKIKLNDGITSIGQYAFANCAIDNAYIPSSINDMKGTAFEDCPIDVMTIGAGATNYKVLDAKTIKIEEGADIVPAFAFNYSKKLEKIILPSSMRRISSCAFGRCTKLTKVIIPHGVKTIDAYAFTDSGLKEIYIPETVTNINEHFASGCRDVDIYFEGTQKPDTWDKNWRGEMTGKVHLGAAMPNQSK